MASSRNSLPSIDAEVLLCTCSTRGERIFSNEAWNHILGGESAIWDCLAPEERVLATECITEASSGSLVSNQVFQVRNPDSEDPLPVLLTFLPVYDRRDDGTASVRSVNITGEVLTEPTTWTTGQSQRRRMEMLGRMTMGIVHDFNNLLSSILGYTELLKSSLPTLLPDHVHKKHLHTIEQAALDGAALVRKIQRYIRQDKQTRFEHVDLPSIVEDCISLTKPYWNNEPRRKGISINVESDLREVPPVMGSPSELREVFVNMLLNAVQAMPDGGVLSLSSYLDEEQGVVVKISDSGAGMNDHVRSRIFEPLFTTKGQQGTGMGLAICYGIVQEHEGTISVESVTGQGSTFAVLLPPAQPAAPVEETEDEQLPGVRGRILVVDDESAIRNILVKLLAIKGHAVHQAASGTEALEVVRNQSLDVVITDLGMPGMSGRELAHVLRLSYPNVRIILLTGHTDIENHGTDVDIVLTKPFKIDELERTIQQMLNLKRSEARSG